MRRSVIAIVVGCVLWQLLLGGINLLLFTLMPLRFFAMMSSDSPPIWLLVESVLISLLTGNIVARIANRNVLWHGLVFGVALLLWQVILYGVAVLFLGTELLVDVWNSQIFWYQILALGLAIPAALAGSWLQRPREREAMPHRQTAGT